MGELKAFGVVAACAITAGAFAQTPDVRLRLDVTGSYRVTDAGPSAFRYYSLFGQYSTLSLRFSLEPGFTGFISQKLQRVPRDGDPDQLDEAYVEDEGIWRVGKQVLPFGTTQVLRESALAARGDTSLVLEGVPMSFAICDAGEGRQRGIVGRIGPKWFGGSFAIGRHFGINATSLNEIRRPEETKGIGRGWQQAFGVDASRWVGNFRLQAEAVHLRAGHTSADPDRTVLDFSATVGQYPFAWIQVGFSRETISRLSFLRFRGSAELTENVTLEPFVRFRDARLWDLGVEVKLKM